MFTQISWSSYIITVLLLSTAYYLFIGYRYYLDDLLQLISGKKTTNDFVSTIRSHEPLVQSFSDEVHAFMEQAVKNKLDKKEIIQSLQLLFKKYPALKDSGLQVSVQDIIINECASYCSIHLSDEELSALWN